MNKEYCTRWRQAGIILVAPAHSMFPLFLDRFLDRRTPALERPLSPSPYQDRYRAVPER